MRYAFLIVGLLIGTVLGSRSSEAQYTNNYQTNTISGVTSNWVGDYYVGNTNFADVLLIQNSGVLSNGSGSIGYDAAASNNSAIVSGGGSVWNNSFNVDVGIYGSGNSLVISNSGKVVNTTGRIGYDAAASNNSVLVSGSGSVWSNSDTVFVGFYGNGNSLVISNGGKVVNGSNGGVIGQNSGGSNNSVVVTGPGSVWTNSGLLSVGRSDSGNSLVISNGGTVFNSTGYIAGNAGNNNSVLVTGTGSVWRNSSSVYLGVRGSGNSLVISDGGTVVSTNLFVGWYIFSSSSNSIVTLNSGNLTVTNPAQSAILDVRRGTLTMNSGTITADQFWATNGVSSIVIFNGGTLTTKTTTIDTGAILQFALGTNGNPSLVSSNLTLGGTLNITDAGGFTNGTYTLFSYGGTLTTNGSAGILTIGTVPNTNWIYTVDISATNYVKLTVTPPPPVAGFSGSPTNGVAPLAVTFTNTSSGWITNGFWNFGDSNTTNTTALSLNHTYTTGATYTVSLTVSGPGGTNTSTLTNYIVALTPAHLVVSPDSRNYGVVTVGQSSNQTFSVINTGQQTLTGSVSSVGSPFAIVSGSPYSVPGGGTNTVTVSFGSVTGGIFTSAVIFASNGGNSTNTVAGIANAPPNVEAGSSRVVTLPVCASLNGGASDDGLPTGGLTTSWTKFSGPGSVTFGNADVTNTTACFSTNGTYVLRLTASDGASFASDDVTVIANAQPQIVAPPATTNTLTQVDSLLVVAGGDDPICFTVGAYDPDANSLSCLWDFGDGATSTNCDPCHVFTNCGPHEVSVTVSDGIASTNATSTVAVACLLDITKMRVKLNFAKTNSDSCSLSATLDLGAGYNLTNKVVTLDIGGTTNTTFKLDARGKGKGNGSFGRCKLAYKKRTGLWTLTANLAKGSWQTPWAAHGLVNSTVTRPGVPVTMTVVVVIDIEAFAGEHTMLYTAKFNKSGSAK